MTVVMSDTGVVDASCIRVDLIVKCSAEPFEVAPRSCCLAVTFRI